MILWINLRLKIVTAYADHRNSFYKLKMAKFVAFSNYKNYLVATKTNHSLTYFILGLLFGLIIGLIIGYRFYAQRQKQSYIPITLQLDKSVKKLDVPKPSKLKKHTKRVKNTINKKKKNKKKTLLPKSNTTKPTQADSLLQLQKDSLQNTKTANDSCNKQSTDSLANIDDSLQTQALNIGENSNTQNKDIHIAKNELIYAIYIEPKGKRSDFLCNSNTKLDSILTNNVTNNKTTGIYVEFWQSPINYTGYKLSHNTLVLFGIYQYTAIHLKYMPNGLLQLNYLNNEFNLRCTDDFIPLLIKPATEKP